MINHTGDLMMVFLQFVSAAKIRFSDSPCHKTSKQCIYASVELQLHSHECINAMLCVQQFAKSFHMGLSMSVLNVYRSVKK